MTKKLNFKTTPLRAALLFALALGATSAHAQSYEFRILMRDSAVDPSTYPDPVAGDIKTSVTVVDFGPVATNTSERRMVELFNNAKKPLGLSGTTVSGAGVFSKGTSTCGTELAAGARCLTEVTFSPTSVGSAAGTLSFTTAVEGAPQSITVKGTAYNPLSLAGGSLPQGRVGTAYAAFNFNNLLGVANESAPNFGSVSWSVSGGLPSGMSFSGGVLSGTPSAATMPSGASIEVTANYKGNQVKKTYTIAVSSNAPVADDIVTSTSLVDFGSVATNSSATRQVLLTNNGSSSVAITALPSISGSAVFAKDAYTCGGTLLAGQSCSVAVVFSPTLVGASTASLTFSTAVAGAPRSVVLRGSAFNPVSMGSATLPEGEQWSAYAPFDFKSLLSVSNEATPDMGGVTVSYTGTLPTGMTLTGGVLSGTPAEATAVEGTPLVVKVSYKGNATTQTYTLKIAAPALPPLPAPTAADISVSVSSIDFGIVATNTTERRPVTLTNNALTELALINSPTVTGGSEFSRNASTCGATLAAGQSCQTEVLYSPRAVGASTAALKFTTAVVGAPADVSIKGTAFNPVSLITSTLPPATLNKPYTAFNFSTLLRVSNEATPNLAEVTWTHSGALPTGLTLVNGVLAGTPTALHAGASFQVTASYKGNEFQQGFVVKVEDAVPLAGEVSTSVRTLDFGAIPANTTVRRQVKLTNSSAVKLAITSAPAVSGDSAFTRDTFTCGASLAAGQTCNVDVLFTPLFEGSFDGTLTYSTAVAGAPADVNIIGSAFNPVSLLPTTLATGNVNKAYTAFNFSTLFKATNEASPTLAAITWRVYNSLPAGMTFVNGVLAGTPLIAGSYTIEVSATYKGNTYQREYVIHIDHALPIAADVATSTAIVDFGVVPTNTTVFKQVALINNALSGLTITAAPTLSAGVIYGLESHSCGTRLDAGSSCIAEVRYRPTAVGASTATLKFNTIIAGAPALVTLKGTGVNPLSLTPFTLPDGVQRAPYIGFDFNALLVASNESAPVLSEVVWAPVGALPAGMTLVNGVLGGVPATASAGAAFQVRATYKGNLIQAAYSVKILAAPVAGNIVVSPTTVDFGSVGANSSSLRSITMTNNAPSALGITAAAEITGNGAYTQDSTTCGASLAAGSSCETVVKYSPTTVGASTASIKLNTVVVNAPAAIALKGTAFNPVALAASEIPFGMKDQAYTSFNFGSLLTVANEASPTMSQVTWSTSSVLPTGMTLVNGVLSGKPLTKSMGLSLKIKATYKGNSFEQMYVLRVGGPVSPGDYVYSSAVGDRHACAITAAKGVKCWGFNQYGQLGDGTVVSKTAPTNVIGLSAAVKSISAGSLHTCALLITGSVQCWGFSNSNETGGGGFTQFTTPVTVPNLPAGVVSIESSAGTTCVITNQGGAYCWGSSGRGQGGNGADGSRISVTPVTGLSTGVVQLSIANSIGCALTNTDKVLCWGHFIKDGIYAPRLVPQPLLGEVPGVASVHALGSDNSVCILRMNGEVYCTGDSRYIGLSPVLGVVQVPALTPVAALSFNTTRLFTGNTHPRSCRLTLTGALECWGAGANGDGERFFRNAPVKALGLETGVTEVSLGKYASCARLANNTLKCWGGNHYGGPGATAEEQFTPLTINID